jgi:hypothetical protein
MKLTVPIIDPCIINVLHSPSFFVSSWLVQDLSLKKDSRQAGITVRERTGMTRSQMGH